MRNEADTLASSLVGRVVEMAMAIQQIPAPTFMERQRAEWIQARFLAEGLTEVSIDDLGNVYGRVPGQGLVARPVIFSAHLDTVFPLNIALELHQEGERISGPGIGDNSLGVAGLFGLLWMVKKSATQIVSNLPGDIWLVANVGEEGLGDLKGMRRVVERFNAQPVAYIILEGMALGQIYHRALGVLRYQITVRTPGGHSWVDYGRPSAIHVLSRLVTQITALPLPGRPRTTLNAGVISGGTTVNTIAAEASLELDLRSEDQETLADLANQVRRLAAEIERPDVQVIIEVIGDRPVGALPAYHPLVELARECLVASGVKPSLSIGSTDANIPLSRGYPAICIGLSTGGGAHTRQEFFNVPPLRNGLAHLQMLAARVHQLPPPPLPPGELAGG